MQVQFVVIVEKKNNFNAHFQELLPKDFEIYSDRNKVTREKKTPFKDRKHDFVMSKKKGKERFLVDPSNK